MSFVLVCWHQAVHGTGKLLHSGFLKWNNNHDDIAEWAPKNTMSKASWLPSSPSSAAALPNPPSSLSSKPSSICASTTHSWSVHKCQPFYLLLPPKLQRRGLVFLVNWVTILWSVYDGLLWLCIKGYYGASMVGYYVYAKNWHIGHTSRCRFWVQWTTVIWRW